MRVCQISKFPPIQGGVSARSYWVAVGLADRGHSVTVVTNASTVEQEHRIWLRDDDVSRLQRQTPAGGRVELVDCGVPRSAVRHIPADQSFVSRLAGIATEVVRSRDCDVLFSYYLEPYGVAGALASEWTDTPHIMQHAGSDRFRLIAQAGLRTTFSEALRAATGVISRSLEGFGVDPSNQHPIVGGRTLDIFSPTGPMCDLNNLMDEARHAGHPWISNGACIPEGLPLICAYGKLGPHKGTYELLQACERLWNSGNDLGLVLLAGGRERESVLGRVRTLSRPDRVWTLPYIPQWHIPEVLRRVDAVCTLERDFPVPIHSPGMGHEVLATGTCLITSGELAEGLPKGSGQGDYDQPYIVVPDPRNIDALTAALKWVIDDPVRAKERGSFGAGLVVPISPAELADRYLHVFELTQEMNGRRSASAESKSAQSLRMTMNAPDLPTLAPMTFGLLGKQLDLFESLDCSEAASSDPIRRALRLLDSLALNAQRLATESKRPLAAITEAIEHDAEGLRQQIDTESQSGTPLVDSTMPSVTAFGWGGLEAANPAMLRPRLANGTLVRTYKSAYLISKLADSPDADSVLVLYVKRGNLYPNAYTIDELTRQVCALADGKRTVTAIVEEFPDAEPGKILARLESLVNSQAIYLL